MSLLPGARQVFGTAAPADYNVGVGRGATPFTTRADLGAQPLMMAGRGKGRDPFGAAPPGYVPGRGRGATGFSGGVSRDDASEDRERGDYSDTNFDEFTGFAENLFKDAEYDEEDRKSDQIYDSIEKKMDTRRKARREAKLKTELQKLRQQKPTIHQQFADLKKNLEAVSSEEWEGIPEIGERGTRNKRRKLDSYVPPPDTLLLEAQKQGKTNFAMDARVQAANNGFATPLAGIATPLAGGLSTPIGVSTPIGLKTPYGMHTPLGIQTPLGMRTPMGLRTPGGSSTPSLSDLGEARGTVLSVKLDKVMNNVSGQTSIDPVSFLTDLNALATHTNVDMADVKKARQLLRSVIQTNPNHAPGWVAAAKLEEAAGNMDAAREAIARGCLQCPKNEDVWREAARLERDNPENAKAVLSQALKYLRHSVYLWIDAVQLEDDVEIKKKILRKALEYIPNSKVLWNEAIALEEGPNQKVLLERAVQCCPLDVSLWLLLAAKCEYAEAQKVLNEARKNAPASPDVWVAAAKLEESQNNTEMVGTIIGRAVPRLEEEGSHIDRDGWLKMAETGEEEKMYETCKQIVKHTMELGVEKEARKRQWLSDSQSLLNHNMVHTARALLNEAVELLKSKKSLWMALADLESRHGTAREVDSVLQRSVKFCPSSEVLWLMAAKGRWLSGDVDSARSILEEAYSRNADSEAITLAAAKLERMNDEFDRARALLEKGRKQIDSPNIWMQSVQLERQVKALDLANDLCTRALNRFPDFPKLWMIIGQIEEERDPPRLDDAMRYFMEGLDKNPKCVPLWDCAVACEMKRNLSKARALLEIARAKNPNEELLWLRTIELERAANPDGKLSAHFLHRAVQECPTSGALWARSISLENKHAQQAKAVTALQKCDSDALVTIEAARLFWRDNKLKKAEKWFSRAVTLNSALGNAWGWMYAFHIQNGTDKSRRDILSKVAKLTPNRGLEWNRFCKRIENWSKPIQDNLKQFAEACLEE